MFAQTLENDTHYKFTVGEIFKTQLGMIRGFVERDYSRDMHCQEFFEINIVLGGSGMHYVGEGRLPVSRGDVFIIPPDLRHGYMGQQGFDVYHLLIGPMFFEKYSADLMLLPAFSALFKVEPAMRERFCSDLHLKLRDDRLLSIMPLLDSISKGSYQDTPENIIICMSEAMILIAMICSEFAKLLVNKESSSKLGSDETFMKSIAHIYERYYEKILISDLCSIAKMSRSAYLTKFKSFTGTSPGEFILLHRIAMASQMLTSTTDSVGEIASKVGFYDTAHFIHTFENRMNMSPLEYRKQESVRTN